MEPAEYVEVEGDARWILASARARLTAEEVWTLRRIAVWAEAMQRRAAALLR